MSKKYGGGISCELIHCDKFYIGDDVQFDTKTRELFEARQHITAIVCVGVNNTTDLQTDYGTEAANAIIKMVERQIINICSEQKDNCTCIPYKSIPNDLNRQVDTFNIVFISSKQEQEPNYKDANLLADKMLKWIDMTCKATISIGITYLKDSDTSNKEWLQRAYKYLHITKSIGKSKIVVDRVKFNYDNQDNQAIHVCNHKNQLKKNVDTSPTKHLISFPNDGPYVIPKGSVVRLNGLAIKHRTQ